MKPFLYIIKKWKQQFIVLWIDPITTKAFEQYE